MASYNFKKITTVPLAHDFVEFTLSKTQRKTPTVVHKQFKISRIRKFYMRKVKFTQQSFRDRINMILTQFPKLEDLNPFYSDLLNTIYNKEHYKLSLGQLSMAMHLIDKIASDYVKLLKYADSLYRCKQLKRAGLGRMVTLIKKQASPLKYLEDIRQHMGRLPTIDPNARSLVLCGCPNAGKSTFLNQITRADVEVEPYAFTTKSLYIGHTDYEYLSWQVIDTPGILDRPFDEMNTIELQSVTALAHIKASIIFILDISEQCNFSVEQQLNIFNSIRPLFKDKPFTVACNKSDVLTLEDLGNISPEKRDLITELENDGVPVFEISTLKQTGVMEVRNQACKRLLADRVEKKMMNTSKRETLISRVHLAMPIEGINKERKPFIPDAVLKAKEAKKNEMEVDLSENPRKRKLEKDIVEEMMEDYTLDLNKTKDLDNPEWNYDPIPQFIDGHNVADFIDVTNYKKLLALEEEELVKIRAGVYNLDVEAYDDEELDILKMGKQICDKIIMKQIRKNMNESNTHQAPMPRTGRGRERAPTTSRLRRELSTYGVDMSGTEDAHFTKSVKARSLSRPPLKKARVDKEGVVRSSSKPPRDRSGVRDEEMLTKVKKIEKRTIKTLTKKKMKRGESDRHVYDLKPKHLFAGKRGAGKTDRR